MKLKQGIDDYVLKRDVEYLLRTLAASDEIVDSLEGGTINISEDYSLSRADGQMRSDISHQTSPTLYANFRGALKDLQACYKVNFGNLSLEGMFTDTTSLDNSIEKCDNQAEELLEKIRQKKQETRSQMDTYINLPEGTTKPQLVKAIKYLSEECDATFWTNPQLIHSYLKNVCKVLEKYKALDCKVTGLKNLESRLEKKAHLAEVDSWEGEITPKTAAKVRLYEQRMNPPESGLTEF